MAWTVLPNNPEVSVTIQRTPNIALAVFKYAERHTIVDTRIIERRYPGEPDLVQCWKYFEEVMV